MKALTEFMNPDFLTLDSNAVQAEWEAGNVAMMNLWGSRYTNIVDDEGSTPEVVAGTRIAAAPSVGGNAIPATTLWWDGFTIAKNASPQDAEATFASLMNGVTREMAEANAEKAVWIIPGYSVGDNGKGVSESVVGGAKPYPMLPFIGLMHNASVRNWSSSFREPKAPKKRLRTSKPPTSPPRKEKGYL